MEAKKVGFYRAFSYGDQSDPGIKDAVRQTADYKKGSIVNKLLMTTKAKGWLLFLALLTLLSITGCYAWINDGYEAESNTEIKVYTINPSTILDSLNRGDTNVFTLQKATPEAGVASPAETVAWSQADFFLIAKALHEQSWKEPLNEQNLYNISFITDCTGVE